MPEGNGLTKEQIELMKKLKAIGADLWGNSDTEPEGEAREEHSEASAPEASVPKKEKGLDALWKTADETVDWTDALAHSTPTDGLTGLRLWTFYHEQAEKVLAGDLEAYSEVLRRANPLGELTEYAKGITMRAVSADRLESTFVCREELLAEKGRTYLSAMGLRIARDLLACLPVSEAAVTGTGEDGRVVFEAVYCREMLHHRNFAFLDPVKVAEEAGARFERQSPESGSKKNGAD